MAVSLTPYLKAVSVAHDQKAEILKWVGDLDDVEILSDDVLVATYARPEKVGSLYMPDSELTEDRFQGKVGLLLKAGIDAFVFGPHGTKFAGPKPGVGDWVVYRAADTHEVAIRKASCRLVNSQSVRMKVSDPKVIY